MSRQRSSQPYLQRGEHDPQFTVLHVSLHQVINHADLSPQVSDLGSHHHKLEDGEQLIHAPHVLVAQ